MMAVAVELGLLTLDSIALMQKKFVNAGCFWHANILANARFLLGEAFKVPVAEKNVEDSVIFNK